MAILTIKIDGKTYNKDEFLQSIGIGALRIKDKDALNNIEIVIGMIKN